MDAEFVDAYAEIYGLFETLGTDAYVYIGSPDRPEGITTLYDVFSFLEYQVKPLLLTGDTVPRRTA